MKKMQWPLVTDGCIEKTLKNMSLEEKIGQMMAVGMPGKYEGVLSGEMVEMIEGYHVGGVVIMARNANAYTVMREYTAKIQETAAQTGAVAPLFILADQEGGIVMQITEGATLFPGNMALGAVGDVDCAYRVAKAIATESLAAGINMVNAPCLDVNTEPDNPIIGLRAFSDSPDLTGKLGAAMIRGFEEAGVVSCGKHFPGHGGSDLDTHLAFPELNLSRQEMDALHLPPFREAVSAGVSSIMTCHINYPALSGEKGIPATLCPRILTDLLRETMKFPGVIITDCLEMDAIKKWIGCTKAAVESIKAGADIVLFSHTPAEQKKAFYGILQAVKTGEIPEAQIDNSVRRILALKLKKYGLWEKAYMEGIVSSAQHLALEEEAAARSVTLVRNEDGLLPLPAGSDKKIAVIYPENMPLLREEDLHDDDAGLIVTEIRKRCPQVAAVRVNLPPGPENIDSALAAAEEADYIIVATSTKTITQEKAQGLLVQKLLATGKPVIAVAVRNPYDLRSYPEVRTYLTTYGYRPCSIRAMAAVIFGEKKPAGKLPVSIGELHPRGHGLS